MKKRGFDVSYFELSPLPLLRTWLNAPNGLVNGAPSLFRVEPAPVCPSTSPPLDGFLEFGADEWAEGNDAPEVVFSSCDVRLLGTRYGGAAGLAEPERMEA